MLVSRQALKQKAWRYFSFFVPWRGPIPRGRPLNTVAAISQTDTGFTWTSVGHAEEYNVEVIVNAGAAQYFTVSTTSFNAVDMSGVIADDSVVIRVKVIADGHFFTDSVWSDVSEPFIIPSS